MSISSTRRSALILLGAVIFPSVAFSQSADVAQIKIYKDPSCSCCGNWAKHMRLAGYAIEGHVPAEAIKKLLVERPKAVGLAVPGMPGGAPGMEAPGVLVSGDP